jgi:hypothetical protein
MGRQQHRLLLRLQPPKCPNAKGQPGRAVDGRQGHQPPAFRPQRQLSTPPAPCGDSSMLFGSSAAPSIATTAASEVSQSVPPKGDLAEPSTDNKDTSPKPSARSDSSPRPQRPVATLPCCGLSVVLFIATTSAFEVSPATARRASPWSPAASQTRRWASPPAAARRASPCLPATSQTGSGRAPGNMANAQGQQGRLCFAFLFEEYEEKAREGRRRTQCAPLALSFINTPFPKTAPLAVLPRFCEVLARSKSVGSSLFRV